MIKFFKYALRRFGLFQSVQSYNFYFRLFKFSMYGMNKGSGSTVSNSGERFFLQRIAKATKANETLTVFDVGANIGNYTKMLLDIFELHDITVHCFEPSLRTFEALKSNNFPENVVVNNYGLSSENKELELYTNKDLSGIASVYNRKLDFLNINMKVAEKPNFRRLDEYCIDNKIRNIFFLKIDVEGHELEVLRGCGVYLKEIRYVQFEFGGSNIDSRTYFQDFYYLLSKSFKIFLILKDGLKEIEEYSEFLEIFTTTNFLAINRNN